MVQGGELSVHSEISPSQSCRGGWQGAYLGEMDCQFPCRIHVASAPKEHKTILSQLKLVLKIKQWTVRGKILNINKYLNALIKQPCCTDAFITVNINNLPVFSLRFLLML